MWIRRVELFNFMCYRKEVIEFKPDGLTAIVGRSGSGKSAIVDAIAFTIYERFIRDRYGVNDAKRRNASKYLKTKVTIEDVGGKQVVIARYRDHPKFKNGVTLFVGDDDRTQGTPSLTNAEIVRVLGVSYFDFMTTNVIAARDDVLNIFTSTDTQLKQYFDSLFDLEWLVGAQKDVVDSVTDAQQAVQEVEEKIAAYGVSLKEAIKGRDNIRMPEGSLLKIKTFKRKLKQYTAAHEALLAQCSEADELVQDVADDYEKKQAEFDAEFKRWFDDARTIKYTLQDATSDQREAVQEFKRCTNAVEELKAHKTTCYACGQPIKNNTKYKNRMQMAQAALAKSGAVVDLADMAVIMAKRAVKDIPPEPQRPVKSRSIVRAGERADALHEKLNNAAELVTQMKMRLESAQTARKSYESMRIKFDVRVDKYTHAISKLKSELPGKRKALKQAQFCHEAFGPRGIRSYALDTRLPIVSEQITRHMSKLIHPDASVRVSAVTALKTSDEVRDKISIALDVPHMATTYGGLSRGQRTRACLAASLALRDIRSARMGRKFNQLFIDEAVDGVDERTQEAIADVLLTVSEQCPLVVMTHSSPIRRNARYLIKVINSGIHAVVEKNDG